MSINKPKLNNLMSKSTTGFTLVEIVVVIGIMGFLSAIIYSSFDPSKAQSRDQKRISDISVIQLALEQYFSKNGIYPLQLASSTNPSSSLVPTYLPSIPTDPTTNIPYSNNYFPLTKTQGDRCISYQLWTTFERNNEFLKSKKSFNSSTTAPLPNGMFECETGHNKTDASQPMPPFIYDVMP